MNLTQFPRRNYLQGPTPIEAAPRFSKALGGKVNVFIKRDDLLPGCAGGNKTRKLDFCIADAIEKGADTIITCGPVQSNHCRLTLSWAVKEEMDCHLILEERVPGSYKEDGSGNNFLFNLMGVKSTQVVPGGSDMMGEMEKLAKELEAQGKKPYIIPGGASNVLGATGYVACAQEIQQQLFQQNINITDIVVPSGSAGTHAGVAVGMYGINSGIRVSGINVSKPKDVQEENVYKLAYETAKAVGVCGELPRGEITCFDGYVGAGYSLPTDSMVEAVKLLARTEAILLDPVYSGKVMAGMIDLIRNDYFAPGTNVLFLHTGGSPALYAYTDTFK
ncbi:D-cysteate sulfo-lyase [Desulfotalea psychrophila]|uniref:Probable 1-aminocyclopropane-1-carboxylate deaminase n=1 Tax=Desulfotalea psychrophila (strain LSv54 / DSM 12343) TaxID=177439 RepID=Q6AN40_DESPS|nr:D-cysteine desulfhydrase [Desulfotalea psychrophila]CAG36234.1 probable 1-aminocyclopropane-1-carboxylate deaminase [Desulfotalea psychrophila LSv54]